MERELLAYLAGAVDSDGSIGVKRSTYAMRCVGDCKQPSFSERVMLRQVTPEIPALLKETFGGSLHLARPSAAKGRPLWSWAVTDKRAAECLRRLRPFLRVKVAQAENALNLRAVKEKSKTLRVARGRGHVGSASRSPELSAQMESLYLAAKRLNKVGV